jgi:ELWxxDGT repeat protein
VIFVAYHTNGIELWKTDGSRAGTVLVKNIYTLVTNNSAPAFAALNGLLLFQTNDGVHGSELWRSDGTAAGTFLLKDINPGGSSSIPQHMFVFNGALYFAANDGTHGTELWRSDGTAAGTVLLKDLYPETPSPGTSPSNPANFTQVGDQFYFTASTTGTGTELWKSDGTAAGTVLVKDINPGSFISSEPAYLTNVNGTLFFAASDGVRGRELWKSDGTSGGTVMVKDIGAGALGSNPHNEDDGVGYGTPHFAVLNGVVYFVADANNDNKYELWRSDGSDAGTRKLAEFSTGYDIRDLTAVDQSLEFIAIAADGSQNLYRATPSGNGIDLVKLAANVSSLNGIGVLTPRAEPGSAVPSDFNGDHKTDLLFGNDNTHGVAIWQMDGTHVTSSSQVGTAPSGAEFTRQGDFNGDGKADMLFYNGSTHDLTVWQMNGNQVTTSAKIGTVANGWHSADSGDFNGDGKTDLLFLNDSTRGLAVWQMNGTHVTANPQIGTIANGWHLQDTGDFNGDGKTDLLFLNDSTHGLAVWQMDGTHVTASPQIGTINAGAGWHFADTDDFNGDGKTDLLFLNDATRGVAVWQMDGTHVTASPQIGTLSAGWHFADTGDFNGDSKTDLLFLNDTTHGVAVWQMDGTHVTSNPQIGTVNSSAGWHYDSTVDVNGDGKTDLLFANDSTHGLAVWQMDGTHVAVSPQIGVVNSADGWHLLT